VADLQRRSGKLTNLKRPADHLRRRCIRHRCLPVSPIHLTVGTVGTVGGGVRAGFQPRRVVRTLSAVRSPCARGSQTCYAIRIIWNLSPANPASCAGGPRRIPLARRRPCARMCVGACHHPSRRAQRRGDVNDGRQRFGGFAGRWRPPAWNSSTKTEVAWACGFVIRTARGVL